MNCVVLLSLNVVQLLEEAHVAGGLPSNREFPLCGSSHSLSARPFRRPESVVAVAMAAGTGRKWGGLGTEACLGEVGAWRDCVSRGSASATVGTPAAPFLTDSVCCCSVTGGCFTEEATGLAATATGVAARVVEWWKSSSEHERAGVLQKAKQTKTYRPGFLLQQK